MSRSIHLNSPVGQGMPGAVGTIGYQDRRLFHRGRRSECFPEGQRKWSWEFLGGREQPHAVRRTRFHYDYDSDMQLGTTEG